MELFCRECSLQFLASEQTQSFLHAMNLPIPKSCPRCRRQRRLAFRNERRMYYRTCDESGKRILALYPASPEKKVVTYTQKTWWDYAKMNPLEFGREFDFSRPFFEQFANLKKDVPRPNLHNTNVENAEFGNHCVGNKDCYMTIGSDLCEGCQFTYWAIRCRDCYDCSLTYDCELCYDCVDLRLCYNCQHVDSSESVTDSQYCYDCVGCFDCFGCVKLRHKKCCFLNRQLTKSEYQEHVRFIQENPSAMQGFLIEYEKLLRDSVLAGVKNVQSESVRGDRLWRCLECFDSFDLEKCQNTSFCSFGFDGITSEDVDFFGQIERLYNGFSAFGQYDCISTIMCHYSHDVHYSEYCISSHHALGCVSLHHHAYCILNKQYKKDEYEVLFPRIVEHMKNTGEWGEFFPVALSPFPYNVTAAQKHYPLTKEEIGERGWFYEDIAALEKQHREEYKTEMTSLPVDTTKIDASICSQVLRCERSGHPYKITPKLFEYLHDRRLALPFLHQDERNEIRMARRNPQYLWNAVCSGCHRQTDSTFPPDSGQRVYCPACYEKHVYGASEQVQAAATT